ncbi:MAG TPA: signal peptidase I [Abditibacteriaceae bacterium]
MSLHIDSWPWKIALILALVGMREFVRLMSGASAARAAKTSTRVMSRRTTETAAPNENAKWLIETLDSAAIAIGLVLFIIQPFLLQAFYIPSGSMEDTLRIDDRLLVSKFIYRLRDPQFQDVVVFKAPPKAISSSSGLPEAGETDFIKRCFGTPGDTVYVTDRKYYHNGKLIPEPYVKWSPSTFGRRVIASYDMKVINGAVYSREYDAPDNPGDWMTEGQWVPAEQQAAITAAQPGVVPPGKYLVFGDHRNNSNDSHAWGFVPRENMVGKAVCVFWPPTRVGVIDHMSFHPRAPQRTPITP